VARRRASLSDRTKRTTGQGVNAFFEVGEAAEKAEPVPTDVRKAATFNLLVRHQDFLDEFVRTGKQTFRHKDTVGVGAINKSVVLQELLEKLQTDEKLQQEILKRLEKKGREEGSRHDPRRTT
jgi:hypothetical protein